VFFVDNDYLGGFVVVDDTYMIAKHNAPVDICGDGDKAAKQEVV
jgi:hypothetical protein